MSISSVSLFTLEYTPVFETVNSSIICLLLIYVNRPFDIIIKIIIQRSNSTDYDCFRTIHLTDFFQKINVILFK